MLSLVTFRHCFHVPPYKFICLYRLKIAQSMYNKVQTKCIV